jgi:hypothetical protein
MRAQEQYILQGLVKRGLPPHVAQAFVMNFKDESGLNPGINEHNPTVPGSRGGFGLYQLTGPRRVAYENFAAQRGVNPSDTDAQLDFLMMEGQGPEKAAFQKILAAPDTGSAASAIVTDFLRPAPQHRSSRVAKYTNSAPGKVGGDSMVARNFDPQVAGQTSTHPDSPFSFGGGGLLAQRPINPELAALAGDEEESTMAKLGGLLAGIGKAIPNAPQPNLGPMPDARKTGGLLSEFLGSMKRRA